MKRPMSARGYRPKARLIQLLRNFVEDVNRSATAAREIEKLLLEVGNGRFGDLADDFAVYCRPGHDPFTDGRAVAQKAQAVLTQLTG